LVRIDARNFELSCNRSTNTLTHANKQTGTITIHFAAASLARSVTSNVDDQKNNKKKKFIIEIAGR